MCLAGLVVEVGAQYATGELSNIIKLAFMQYPIPHLRAGGRCFLESSFLASFAGFDMRQASQFQYVNTS